MNERLEELAEQAGFGINPLKGFICVPGLNPTVNLKLEKFAELIVRECADIAKTAAPYSSDDLILKRFGFDDGR